VLGAFHKLLRIASRVSGMQVLQQRMRFRGLALGARVNLRVEGELRFGKASVINEGANILVPVGASLELGAQCYVGRFVELGPGGHILIGDDTSLQDRTILVGDVTIGRHCMISLNVLMTSGRHYYDIHPEWLIRDQDRLVQRDPVLSARHSRPIRIEDDCWIGINSVIMPGVTVGRGAIVGAGSIVTRDVEPYTVVAGSPARLIKNRVDFVPPRRIHFAKASDWPYFYAGFDLRQSAVQQAAEQGGLLASGSIVLRLNTSGARSLWLSVQAQNGAQCILEHGSQRQQVEAKLTVIQFDIAVERPQIGIHIDIEPASACVRVAEVWVE
jgi:acetyltransferase-like isoleucine patch superfamily enzyme